MKETTQEPRLRCWVILARQREQALWTYWVSHRDPADLEESLSSPKLAKHFKPFTYWALQAELAGQGITAIPAQSYFLPTLEEREENADALFRHISA